MSMPNQNSGIEYVNIVKPSKPWSYPVPRRQPWEIPIQMPIAIDAIVDPPISRTVGHTASAIVVLTEALLTKE